MNNKSTMTWVSIGEAARIIGVTQGSASKTAQRHGWRRKRDGKLVLVARAQVEDYARQRAARAGQEPGPKPVGSDNIGAVAFAERVGLSESTVRAMRSRGEIESYTTAEAARVVAERTSAAVEPGKTALQEPGEFTLAQAKREREFWAARLQKAKALQQEGKIYQAEEVDAWAVRLGQLIQARITEVPRQLPDAIAGRSVEEVRGVLAAWEARFREDLAAALLAGPGSPDA